MVEFSLDSRYKNPLIGRNLASCSCVVCYFIGVLLLSQTVFDIRGGHRCNDSPRIGVWGSRMRECRTVRGLLT